MLTLAIADINGGIVLPGVEALVEFVNDNDKFAKFRRQLTSFSDSLAEKVKSKVLKEDWVIAEKNKLKAQLKDSIKSIETSGDVHAKRAIKAAFRWFGKAGKFALKALGPLTDALSIGLSAWNLKMAVENGDTNKIISSSLALASGIVGLATFVAVVITGAAILGPVGLIIGALLGLAASLVEIFGGSPINDFRDQMAQLNEIKNASMYQIFPAIEFLNETGRPFNDVYVVNEAALINVEENSWDDVELKEGSGIFKHSLVRRRPVSDIVKWSKHPDIINASFLLQGHQRYVYSPVYYKDEEMKWVKSPFDYGFDFYGQNPKGEEYVGVRVLVKTNLTAQIDKTRRGIYINTTVPSEYKQDDVIRLGDYANIALDKKVTIDTGPGNDALNIDGLVGKLEPAYENKLEVTLDTLNLGGVSREESRFQRVLFNALSGQLSYIVSAGQDRLHSVGFIQEVIFFGGSPLNDVIVLQPLYDESSDETTDSNMDDVFQADFVVTESYGANNYLVNLSDTTGAGLTKISVIDHSPNQSYITIYNPERKFTWKHLVYENRTLHIYKELTPVPESILMSIYLRFSKQLPRIRMLFSAVSRVAISPNVDRYRPIYSVNPILLLGNRSIISFNTEETILGTNENDLAELSCPENLQLTLFPRGVNLENGIDNLLVSLKFIEECVENQEIEKKFMLSRFKDSTNWFVKIVDKDDPSMGMPEVTLIGVERVINEHGHVLVDLERAAEENIDLHERYFQETKRQLGYQDTSNEDHVTNTNDEVVNKNKKSSQDLANN